MQYSLLTGEITPIHGDLAQLKMLCKIIEQQNLIVSASEINEILKSLITCYNLPGDRALLSHHSIPNSKSLPEPPQTPPPSAKVLELSNALTGLSVSPKKPKAKKLKVKQNVLPSVLAPIFQISKMAKVAPPNNQKKQVGLLFYLKI